MSSLKKKFKDVESSIIQIFADHVETLYSEPWNTNGIQKSTSSGFCVEVDKYLPANLRNAANRDKYIITNAHCVKNAKDVFVKKRGDATRYRAVVDAIIYECDLAILSINHEFYKDTKVINEFWDTIKPLEIGGYPNKLDVVYVYGYPLGGYNISVTTGAVNRIQTIEYFNIVSGIVIQIDAPINHGNSGGPVINDAGLVIGVAFSGEDDSNTQNMGYIIPTTFIRYFINEIKQKQKFAGLCALGINYQELNNIGIREYLKLDSKTSGILVNAVEKFGSSDEILQVMDVITKINNITINNDGTMTLLDIIKDVDKLSNAQNYGLLHGGEIAPYHNFISLKYYGDVITLSILRDGVEKNVKITLKPKQFLVPVMDYQIEPSYLILMGLVFIPVTLMAYFEKKQNREATSHINYYFNQSMKYPDQQIIMLSQVVSNQFTDDCPDDNFILKSLNDIEIINLAHLHKTIIKDLKTVGQLIFKFSDTSKVLILSAKDIVKNHETILNEHFGNIDSYVCSSSSSSILSVKV